MAAASNPDGGEETLGVDAVDLERYVAIRVGEGDVLLFDQDRSTAWLQSDVAVSVEEVA